MQSADGSFLCIALTDVERLRADNFRQGNIVLDITVSKGAEIQIEDVAYAHGLEEKLLLASNAFLKNAMLKFMSEEKILVKINPSYGCTLICICSGVEILEPESVFPFGQRD